MSWKNGQIVFPRQSKNSYEFFEPEKTVLEELSKHKTILEVGSGMGRYTKLIPRVVGLEYSRPFLDHCRENIQGLFLRGDGFHIPFKDNSFDCVFSSGVFGTFSMTEFDLRRNICESASQEERSLSLSRLTNPSTFTGIVSKSNASTSRTEGLARLRGTDAG
ncbi:MAG: class I SAM-dependent methyltransferase [Candidatus Omnitrophica bacterium]|nr:class I SAM-dependent methyltransferase [Candidatus Omnitrophota bacterium]